MPRRAGSGHGKYVKWVLEPLGWKVQPVTVDGVIAVPRPVMIKVWIGCCGCVPAARTLMSGAQHRRRLRASD